MNLERLLANTISRVEGIFHDVEYTDGETLAVEMVRASISRDVQYIGEMMQSVELRTEITLIKSEVPAPRRGDFITESDGHRWEVESRIADDAGFVTVSVKPLIVSRK